MSTGSTFRRIGIMGHYNGRNLGDECLVAAVIQNIRARSPGAEIVGFSLNPADTERRHGIPSYAFIRSAETVGQPKPDTGSSNGERLQGLRSVLKQIAPLRAVVKSVRRAARAAAGAVEEIGFLCRSYRNLGGVDLLVVAGSQPLFDGWDGPWSHPYNIFKWALLARLRGIAFVQLSVGAGPIDYPLSRLFLRQALRWSAYRSFRDQTSVDAVRSLGVPGENPIFPDLAFSLDLSSIAADGNPVDLRRGRGIVGVNPFPHYDGRHMPKDDPALYREFLKKMTDFAAWLLRRGYSVMLLSTQTSADPKVCADMVRILAAQKDLELDGRLVTPPIHNYDDLIRRLSECDFVVAARFHGIVLSLFLAKPVVALAYHPKTFDLMAYMGQPDCSLDIETFETEELIERFERLEGRRAEVEAELARRVPGQRRALAEQYDRLFGVRAS